MPFANEALKLWVLPSIVMLSFVAGSFWYVSNLQSKRIPPNISAVEKTKRTILARIDELTSSHQGTELKPLLLAAKSFERSVKTCGLSIKPMGDSGSNSGIYSGSVPHWRYQLESKTLLSGAACLTYLLPQHDAVLESAALNSTSGIFVVAVFGKTTS